MAPIGENKSHIVSSVACKVASHLTAYFRSLQSCLHWPKNNIQDEVEHSSRAWSCFSARLLSFGMRSQRYSKGIPSCKAYVRNSHSRKTPSWEADMMRSHRDGRNESQIGHLEWDLTNKQFPLIVLVIAANFLPPGSPNSMTTHCSDAWIKNLLLLISHSPLLTPRWPDDNSSSTQCIWWVLQI